MTVVCAAAELFALLGSASSDDTLAWFDSVPGADGRTRIWMVAVPSSASVPSAQVTVPADCEQLPWEGVADSNVTPLGSVSVTVAPVASCGPALCAVSV